LHDQPADIQTNEPLCGVLRPKGQRQAQGIAKMTKDEMIGWFKSAPMGSRHERMLWAACKIAHLSGATESGAYQILESVMIEAERLQRLNFRDSNDRG
jgi:hypothetical protein